MRERITTAALQPGERTTETIRCVEGANPGRDVYVVTAYLEAGESHDSGAERAVDMLLVLADRNNVQLDPRTFATRLVYDQDYLRGGITASAEAER